MPKDTKVWRCVQKVKADGKSVGSAIAICQKSTGLSYATGKPPKTKGFKEWFAKEEENLNEMGTSTAAVATFARPIGGGSLFTRDWPFQKKKKKKKKKS